MADELRVWRYTPGRGAPERYQAGTFVRLYEGTLKRLETALGIAITGPATLAEIDAGAWIGRPDPQTKRRVNLGLRDAEYLRLTTLAEAEADKEAAAALRVQADARADALIAEADTKRTRG